MTVRPAAVAGAFYPAEPQALASLVADLLTEAEEREAGAPSAFPIPPKAIIAPHAGYLYSGAVAASAYVALRSLKGRIQRAVILGPSHRFPVDGLEVPAADAFATPIGAMKVDRRASANLAAMLPSSVQISDVGHAQEHSLEVQLPFLRETLGDVEIIPIVVGRSSPKEIEQALDHLWGGPETVIIVSSDLSHYLDQATCRERDRATAEAIEAFDEATLDFDDACGCLPIAGLLRAAKKRNMSVRRLQMSDSGETGGPRDRVVGYGAWAFYEPMRDPLLHEEDLVRIAVRSLAHGLKTGKPLHPSPGSVPEALRHPGAAFVTLTRLGDLRGCIGSIEPRRSLAEDVAENAFKAAFADPRFLPLSVDDVPGLKIEISVLTPPIPLSFKTEAELLNLLRPGIDGLIIEDWGRRALFLPSVWKQVRDPEDFLKHLKLKAGLSPTHASSSLQAWRFSTRSIEASDPALAELAALVQAP